MYHGIPNYTGKVDNSNFVLHMYQGITVYTETNTFAKKPKLNNRVLTGANVPLRLVATKKVAGFSRILFNLLCFGRFAAGQHVVGCFSLTVL